VSDETEHDRVGGAVFELMQGRPRPPPAGGADSRLIFSCAAPSWWESARGVTMSGANVKAVLEAVRTAIITELRGCEIYKAAAERATDPSAKQMFQSLADDEQTHKDFLEKNYRSLLQEGEWAIPATPENLTPLDHSDIVNTDFLKRVKGGAFEMAVIAAGVELERSAIEYYHSQARECPDDTARKTFQFLADWEKGHLESLREVERSMRDEYFADLGFSPL
jgi:rubrerythrin